MKTEKKEIYFTVTGIFQFADIEFIKEPVIVWQRHSGRRSAKPSASSMRDLRLSERFFPIWRLKRQM